MAVADPKQFLDQLHAGIEHLAPRDTRVLLAVSGGPDSLALLLGWRQLASDFRHELHVGHFDHGWRKESADDGEFVAQWACRLSLPFHLGAVPLSSDPSPRTEVDARSARYQFLVQTANRVGGSLVATGHTSDDQVETVLFAILRGSGLHGLAGMPASRPLAPGVLLVRPMLEIPRALACEYLSSQNACPLADTTNDDIAFARNRVRHELLPGLRERFNPLVDEAILRLAGQAKSATGILDRLATELLRRSVARRDDSEVVLSVEPLASADRYLVAAAFRLLLDQQHWPRRGVGQAELNRMVAVACGVDRACDLPDGLRIERRRDMVGITLCRPQ